VKLQTKIIVLLIPLVLIPLLFLGYTAYLRLDVIVRNSTNNQVRTLIEETRRYIQHRLQSATSNIVLFSNSRLLTKYMKTSDAEERYLLIQPALLKEFKTYQEVYPEYYDIWVVMADGTEDARSITKNNGLIVPPNIRKQFLEFVQSTDSNMVHQFCSVPSPFHQNRKKTTLIIGKKIFLNNSVQYFSPNNSVFQGFLMTAIDLSFIDTQINTLRIGKGGYLIITDAQMNILFFPDMFSSKEPLPKEILLKANSQSMSTGVWANIKYYITKENINDDLTIIGMIPANEMTKDSQSMAWLLAIVTLTTITLTFGLVFLVIRLIIIRPIHKLNKAIDVVGEGKYNVDIDITSKDEIGSLASAFNQMLGTICERDKKLAETAIVAKEARVEAESANIAKSEFLANMSHELRTPLNHIIGFTDLVLNKSFGELNETQSDYLNDVLESSHHLLSLINDILDLSRVESGKLTIEKTILSLPHLIENSLKIIREKARKRNIQLTFSVGNIADESVGDHRKYKQIIYNLLANAVKFTPDGGSIHLTAETIESTLLKKEFQYHPQFSNFDFMIYKEWILISISDTGIGIQPFDLERIFEPFEQADGSINRQFEGTGLGLSLSRKLVNLFGGRIWAESSGRNEGSTFRFILPENI